MILGVFLVLSINITTISAQIDEYFTKGGRDGNIESLGQGYEMSRGFLIARMLSNIEEHPFVGIGFGVSSIPEEMTITYDPIFGAPLGAPVEKGVLPVAIIEEFGFFLGGAIFALLGLILYFGFKLGPESFSLIIVFYLLNLGEAMLFSPGGMGMLLLILLSSVVARGWNGQRI
jgi:hypothetical protein